MHTVNLDISKACYGIDYLLCHYNISVGAHWSLTVKHYCEEPNNNVDNMMMMIIKILNIVALCFLIINLMT